MEILDFLEKNKFFKIIMNKNNVMLLMKYIIDNRISNVRYFISNELKLNHGAYVNGLKRIAIENTDFYNYYNKVLNESKSEKLQNINYALEEMGKLMNNGIELEDGSYREFDMYDWFIIKNKYFDNLNRIEISKILNDFGNSFIIYKEDINFFELRAMISNAFGDSLSSYSEPIYKEYILKDKFNNLTEDETLKLLNFMVKNNVPFNYRNYCFGVEKMKKQRNFTNDIFKLNIDIDKNKKLIKKK